MAHSTNSTFPFFLLGRWNVFRAFIEHFIPLSPTEDAIASRCTRRLSNWIGSAEVAHILNFCNAKARLSFCWSEYSIVLVRNEGVWVLEGAGSSWTQQKALSEFWHQCKKSVAENEKLESVPPQNGWSSPLLTWETDISGPRGSAQYPRVQENTQYRVWGSVFVWLHCVLELPCW